MKEITYEDLRLSLKSYMKKEELELIDKYYKEAESIYEGMYRKTKEPYISHSIFVALILSELKMDPITIGCALIHEAITLEKRTFEEIKDTFGEETAVILNSISKISSLKRTFKKEENTQKYRRIVVNLAENPKAIYIKLADRLNNLQTIYVHDNDHIKEVIKETNDVFIPIAHRLGIKKIKADLEDICLRVSKPKEYESILKRISSSKEELESNLNTMKEEIIKILDAHEINYKISSRVKSVRGIYNKLAKGKKWEDIFDLLGIRVLVDKVEECYLVMGLIHAKYAPIQKRFKDYIANPKGNMYQSLHTTVFGVNNMVYEIQVRTYDMDEIAEHGVASHWSYKEKTDGSKKTDLEDKLELFRTLIEVNDMKDNVDFFKNLNTNLNKEEIYVYTPKGDVIELPIDSTPIDFAYKIHTAVGDDTVSALVNNKIVKLNHKLQEGDIVELKTQKDKGPSKAWLKFVKTDQAKSRIRSYFYKKEKQELVKTGNDLIINEIKKRNLKDKELLSEENLKKCLSYFKLKDFEDLCISVSSLKYSPNIIVNRLSNVNNPNEDITKKLSSNKVSRVSSNNVLVSGFNDLLTTNCSKCNPIFGDDIIGYVSKGKGVVIHKKTCKYIDLTSDRIIEASWIEDKTIKYVCELQVELINNEDHLLDLISIATKLNINVISFDKNKDNFINLKCKVDSVTSLNKLIEEIKKCKYVINIERKN